LTDTLIPTYAPFRFLEDDRVAASDDPLEGAMLILVEEAIVVEGTVLN
jgi:hypothetical protein